MNASKLVALFLAIGMLGTTVVQAGEALGPAKARGDFRPFSEAQQPVSRSRSIYRYRAPVARTAPRTQQTTESAVAAAPSDSRRYSAAPSTEQEAVASSPKSSPCPSTPSVSDSGRRYSYAPAPATSGNSYRSYSRGSGHSSQPAWSLLKTDPRKYSGL